jgi:hypothetical protein
MPYQHIDYLSQRAIAGQPGRDDTIVISICSPGTRRAHLEDGFRAVLYLEFDNTEHLSGRLVRFSRAHAEAILAFVEQHEAAASRILVNCMMGESRSAGVACYLSEKYQVPLARPPEHPLRWVIHALNRTAQFAALRATGSREPLPPAVCPR